MKDIIGFCKVFDLNVPNFDDFEYYKEQFSKLERWKNLDKFANMYEQAEYQIGDMFEYRMKKTDEIVDFIKSSRAYHDLCDENLLPDYETDKSYNYQEDKIYLSVDLKKANWQSVKWHDPLFINELGDSYEELLDKFNLPEVFKYSKHFRQYIFGNLNPKKQMKMQRYILEYVIKALEKFGFKKEFVKHDEVCYSIDSHLDSHVILDLNTGGIKDGILPDLMFPKIEVGIKLFTIKKQEDFRINQYLDFNTGEILHKEPVGCSGHKFFMALKKYVFEEPLDIRDLYFRSDGQLAIWKVDGLSISLKN